MTIGFKRSYTADFIPSSLNLKEGEPFFQFADGKIYSKNNNNTIVPIASLNASDDDLRDRSTHHGSQPMTSITGLSEALDSKQAAIYTGTVTTAAATAAKLVTVGDGSYQPKAGDFFLITYTLGTTASNATLNINGSGAKNVRLQNTDANNTGHRTTANGVLYYYFDGSFYHLVGSQQQSNTTYVGMTGSVAANTAATLTLAINRYYTDNYAGGQTLFTLPATAAHGSIIEILSVGEGGFRITAPAGDNILMGSHDSGAAGYIEVPQGCFVRLRCLVANTTWRVIDATDTITNNNEDTFRSTEDAFHRENHIGEMPQEAIAGITAVGMQLLSATDAENARWVIGAAPVLDRVSVQEAEAGVANFDRNWTAALVRAAANAAIVDYGAITSVSWGDVTGKPSTFPPSEHNHSGVYEPAFSKKTAFNKDFGTTADTVTQGNDARLSNAREWTAEIVSQNEAETGTATTPRKWTAQRVRQAILSWWNSSAAKSKLDDIGDTIANLKTVNGETLEGPGDISLDEFEKKTKISFIPVSCSTTAGTAAKVGTTVSGDYVPQIGDMLLVTFTESNTHAAATLNIDGSGAYPIYLGGRQATAVSFAGLSAAMFFTGTAYELFGSQRLIDNNSAYTGITGSTAANTAATLTLTINRCVIDNYAGKTVYTLPTTAAIGSVVEIIGRGSGGFRIVAPAGDNILMGEYDSGAAGFIEVDQGTLVKLRCVVANTTWVVVNTTGFVTNNNDDVYSPTLPDAQKVLVSGENIKTVGGQSLLGEGDIPLGGEQPFVVVERGAGNVFTIDASLSNNFSMTVNVDPSVPHVAPSVRDAKTYYTAANNNPSGYTITSANQPAREIGDVLLYFIKTGGTKLVNSVTNLWTLLDFGITGDQRHYLAYRVVDGTEGTFSVTLQSSVTGGCVVAMYSIKDVEIINGLPNMVVESRGGTTTSYLTTPEISLPRRQKFYEKALSVVGISSRGELTVSAAPTGFSSLQSATHSSGTNGANFATAVKEITQTDGIFEQEPVTFSRSGGSSGYGSISVILTGKDNLIHPTIDIVNIPEEGFVGKAIVENTDLSFLSASENISWAGKSEIVTPYMEVRFVSDGETTIAYNESQPYRMATALDIPSNSTESFITPYSVALSVMEILPSGGENFLPDWNTFMVARWLPTASRTLLNPINVTPGTTRIIVFQNPTSTTKNISAGANYIGWPSVSLSGTNNTIVMTLFALSSTEIAVASVEVR